VGRDDKGKGTMGRGWRVRGREGEKRGKAREGSTWIFVEGPPSS